MSIMASVPPAKQAIQLPPVIPDNRARIGQGRVECLYSRRADIQYAPTRLYIINSDYFMLRVGCEAVRYYHINRQRSIQ